jgi:hypothetical protein
MSKQVSLGAIALIAALTIPSAFAADDCEKPKKEPADGCKIQQGSLVLPTAASLKRGATTKPAPKVVKKKTTSR